MQPLMDLEFGRVDLSSARPGYSIVASESRPAMIRLMAVSPASTVFVKLLQLLTCKSIPHTVPRQDCEIICSNIS